MSATDSSPVKLAYRLEREGSRGGQAGCALFLALQFGAIAALMILYPMTHPEESDKGMIWAVGGGLALLALVLLYAGIHQWFAMKTPETTVEMNEPVLTRGSQVTFVFRQPGPVSIESLRANLVFSCLASLLPASEDQGLTNKEDMI